MLTYAVDIYIYIYISSRDNARRVAAEKHSLFQLFLEHSLFQHKHSLFQLYIYIYIFADDVLLPFSSSSCSISFITLCHISRLQGHPELPNLRSNYLQWLMTSGQEEKAGEVWHLIFLLFYNLVNTSIWIFSWANENFEMLMLWS